MGPRPSARRRDNCREPTTQRGLTRALQTGRRKIYQPSLPMLLHPQSRCNLLLVLVALPVRKSVGCSHRSSSAAGVRGPCQSQEPGSGDGGCRVTPPVKASVMFTKVF